MKKNTKTHPHQSRGSKNGFWSSILFMAFLLSAGQLTAQNIWEGDTDSDWATASNWSFAAVPIDTEDVVIPITDNDPIISAATVAIAKSVSVQSGATLTIAALGRLAIDNATYYGLDNEGTVNNNGILNLGTVTSVANQGILNYGTFNNNGGEIHIDRASVGVTNYTGTFTNNGILRIGESVGINSAGIYNEANFVNTSNGELHILKAGSSGIYNLIESSFSNGGLIELGVGGNIGGPAIYNFVDFQNNLGAEIKIENAGYGIDHRNGATFDNLGTITIGANAPVIGSAIFNEGTFNNTGNGMMIDSSRVGIDNRFTGIFNNSANLFIGANTTIESIGIYNQNEFTNDGVEITIDRVLNYNGLLNDYNAEFDNTGKITIGGEANVANLGLVNYGLFTNQSTAEISINRINSSYSYSNINGIYNGNNSIFHNWGKLLIGNEAGTFNHGLFNAAAFTNYAGAEIIIDRITGEGFSQNGLYNDGAFTNSGKLSIGDAVSAGKFGLFNDGTSFINDGGEININHVNSGEGTHCFYNHASFTNNGTINIGNIANGSDWGLFNTSTFENTGELNIDRTALVGFRNSYGVFNNSGTFNIGQSADIGEWGFWNEATFNNLATGIINIDRSTIGELLVKHGSLVNEGWISVSTHTSVAQYGFWNDASFDNAACGTFEVFAAFSNNDAFTNAGLLVVNSEDTHLNSGFENDGVIAYFQDNPIPDVTNNEIIVTPLSTECGIITPALDLAAMIDLTIGTTWYQDEALSIPAGDYDQGTNTFTFTNAPAGETNTLYFSVTNDLNNCANTVPVDVSFTDVTPPTISCPETQTLSLGSDCTALLPDYTGMATADDNCSVAGITQDPEAGTTVSTPGDMTIELTVTDSRGLTASCAFTLTKIDDTAPVALCQNATVQLDGNGNGSITLDDIDAGSSDGCALATENPLSLDINAFSCANVGNNTVTLTVTDANNNENTCTASVMVIDEIMPVITTCEGNFAVFNGEAEIDAASAIDFAATDACGILGTTYEPAVITCEQLGQNVEVLVTVTDMNGNSNDCIAIVKTDGLACGFASFGDDGIDCEDSSEVTYDVPSASFTLTSYGCATANFSQDNAAYVQSELCGDGEIIAHVTSINPLGQGWAGITMRESEAPGAKKVELLVNLGNLVRRAIRTTTNGYAFPGQFFRPQATWLRLVRTGNQFVGYVSTNGLTWQLVMAVNVPMNSCIQAGLMVTNYNGSTTVAGTFDNVAVTEYSSSSLAVPHVDNQTVQTVEQIQDFSIFPNPAKEEIQVDLINYFGQEIQVQILNELGQPVLQRQLKEVGSKPERFDLHQMPGGTYFIQVITDLGDSVKKFLIVK